MYSTCSWQWWRGTSDATAAVPGFLSSTPSPVCATLPRIPGHVGIKSVHQHTIPYVHLYSMYRICTWMTGQQVQYVQSKEMSEKAWTWYTLFDQFTPACTVRYSSDCSLRRLSLNLYTFKEPKNWFHFWAPSLNVYKFGLWIHEANIICEGKTVHVVFFKYMSRSLLIKEGEREGRPPHLPPDYFSADLWIFHLKTRTPLFSSSVFPSWLNFT